jgi:hypothetical protein
VATLNVKNISALTKACEKRGLKVRQGKTYSWYGSWVGDYHASDAAYRDYDPKMFGKNAEYVIYDPKAPHAYEVGVVPHKDKDGSYTLMLDFFGSQGKHISKMVGGHGSEGLVQDYQLEVLREEAQPLLQNGYTEHLFKDQAQDELVPIWTNEGIPDEIQQALNEGKLILFEQ